MADNVRGGSTDTLLPAIATDDVGGVHYQRIKLDVGADGASTPVTAAAPLPVTSTQLPASLGQKAAAASASVVLASDQGAVSVSQPGLSGGGLTTWTAVAATQTAIPATPLAGRATLLVQAWEGNALPIFIGFSGLTARVYGAIPGAADGILLLAGQSYPISLAAGVILYARATATGCYVGVQEVAA